VGGVLLTEEREKRPEEERKEGRGNEGERKGKLTYPFNQSFISAPLCPQIENTRGKETGKRRAGRKVKNDNEGGHGILRSPLSRGAFILTQKPGRGLAEKEGRVEKVEKKGP